MSPRLDSYFHDYDAYHRTSGNEICHFLGIPMIVISLFGLLANLPFATGPFLGSPLFRADCGTLLWALACIWYLCLDSRIGFSFSFVALAGYFVGRTIPVPMLWVLFVVGWVFQGIGHAIYEKKSPAFFRNFHHVLIGPLWTFAKLTGVR